MKQKILQIYFSLLASLAKKYIRKHKPLVIGVHGSVGKTSCRLIIAQTLQHFFPNKKIYSSPQNFNGELGMSLSIFQIEHSRASIPGLIKHLLVASKKLFSKTKPYDLVVLEYGIDRPGEMDFLLDIVEPNITISTKLDAVHSMQFGSPEAIAQEELKILSRTLQTVFVNEAEPYTQDSKEKLNVDVLSYQTQPGKSQADIQSHLHNVQRDAKLLVDVDLKIRQKTFGMQTNLYGEIHYGYIGVAVTIADMLHYQWYQEEIFSDQKILLEYALMAGRYNFFAGVEDSIILDSSYNAAPLSIRAVIDSALDLHQEICKKYEVWMLLGDMRELGDETEKEHKELAHYIRSKKPDKLFLVGAESKKYIVPEILEAGCDQKKLFHDFDAQAIGHKIKSLLTQNDKKVFLIVKGSQNTIFLEEAVKVLLANPSDAKNLTRQSKSWLEIKKHQK